nr:EOG090X0DDP [Triops cancriformis]
MIPLFVNIVLSVQPKLQLDFLRHDSNKHWDPKFKRLRRLKVQKIDLPNFNEDKDSAKLTPDEMRAKMKEKGILPPRPWQEKPVYISSTSATFEPYVPPEGDGKISPISLDGAKQSLDFLSKKGKSYMAVRKIRNFEEDFDPKLFAEQAQDIYIASHRALADKDKHKLRETATEKAYADMIPNTRLTTIRWNFMKSLEPPRVVHVRCTDVISKDNLYGQITVRFHTQQTLAVYDRFGRLMHGSEVVAKDVLEYVVFEKHLANEYGTWRIHDKIIPDWMPPKEPAIKTYQYMIEKPEEPTPEAKEVSNVVSASDKSPNQPTLATA